MKEILRSLLENSREYTLAVAEAMTAKLETSNLLLMHGISENNYII